MSPLRSRSRAVDARARSAAAFVQAAEDLAAEGVAYADVSVGQIAERAGFSRASFYAHFTDKLALATAVGQRLTEALGAVTEPWLDGHDPRPIDAILADVAATFAAHRGAVLLITEAAAYDPDIRALRAALATALEDPVAERVRLNTAAPPLVARASAFVLVWSTQAILAEMLQRTPADATLDPATLAALSSIWESALNPGAARSQPQGGDARRERA